MACLNRYELLDPEAIDTVHVYNRVVRRCLLFGDDPVTGKNYDHRKGWIEDLIALQAKYFAIDLLGFSIMSNHFHQILRSRPDVTATWGATEVARHWLVLCPKRKGRDGQALEPKQNEINSICNDLPKLKQIRRRLSDISWWMRLLCQKVAQRARVTSTPHFVCASYSIAIQLRSPASLVPQLRQPHSRSRPIGRTSSSSPRRASRILTGR